MAAVAVALRCHPDDLRSMSVSMFNAVLNRIRSDTGGD